MEVIGERFGGRILRVSSDPPEFKLAMWYKNLAHLAQSGPNASNHQAKLSKIFKQFSLRMDHSKVGPQSTLCVRAHKYRLVCSVVRRAFYINLAFLQDKRNNGAHPWVRESVQTLAGFNWFLRPVCGRNKLHVMNDLCLLVLPVNAETAV